MQDLETQTNRNTSFAIPVAIIFGFGLIAAAIYFSGSDSTDGTKLSDTETTEAKINPITEEDHIRGNPNAPVLIVEYSDFDCPFCKSFHETMNLVMDEFGASGQVGWVYRHFPLPSLHPSAPYLAEASECVAKYGGNDAFWTFTDLIFSERGTNEPTNLTRLGEFAKIAGVEEEELQACLDSQETRPNVEEDFNNAVDLGARGTPYSVVLAGNQQMIINGAQPYAVVRQMVGGLTGEFDN